MKQELQNFFVYAKKGFLLVELLLAMSILASMLIPLSLYQMQTYTLYKNAYKRHQVLNLVTTVFETIAYTGQLPREPIVKDGITITSKPYSFFKQEDDSGGFVTLQATWKQACGAPGKASFISFVPLHKVMA